jgi:hypothetical protein
MKTNHTAGQWSICNQTETQIFIASTKEGARTEQGKGGYICQIKQEREHYGINEQDEANAMLIAASPLLYNAAYSALQAIYAMSKNKQGFYQYLINDLLNALNKADGTII